MKKILFTLLTLVVLFSCGEDKKEEIVDLDKYPLYNTKWIYNDVAGDYQGNDTYYIFGKDDGIIISYFIIDNKFILVEDKLTYVYNPPDITITYTEQRGLSTRKGIIIGDSLYFEYIDETILHKDPIVFVFYKDKTY